MRSTVHAGDLLPPRPSPAPLGETATNHSNISFHRALHHREHRGNFPSHSSAVFLFCNFSNYREHFNETGYLLLSTSLSPSGFAALPICYPADVTVTLCSATTGWCAAGLPGAWHPLEGKERVAQGSSRQIDDLTGFSVDLEQTGVTPYPYTTASPYPTVSIPNFSVIYTTVKPE